MGKTTTKKARKSPNAVADQAVLRCVQTAHELKIPRDQLENFLLAGVVLQPHQLKASAAARECDRPDGPTKVAFGGARGPGKSFWGIAQTVVDDCQRYPGLKVLLLRKVGKSNREAFEDLRRAVLQNVPHEYRRAEAILELENGSRVVLGHFQDDRDIDKYLGLEYDVVLIEEATTLTEATVRMILTCLRTSKSDWRPRAYFTTNPGNIGHAWFKKWFVEPFRQGRETDTRFIPATVYDNQYINREYRAELENLTGWQRKAWLLGDWDVAAGQFFTTWRHDIHVVSAFTVESIGQHWEYFLSMDYGFQHWNVVYLMATDGDGHLYLIDELATRRQLPEKNMVEIDQMLERWQRKRHTIRRFVAGGDVFQERGSEKTIAQRFKEHGYTIKSANMGRVSRASELLRRLGDPDNGIAPTISISEKCQRLIETIPDLQHDENFPDKVKKVDADADGNGGDDAYDAAGYGLLEAQKKRGAHGF